MRAIGTQLSSWLRQASRSSLPAPTSSGIARFSSSAKKQVRQELLTRYIPGLDISTIHCSYLPQMVPVKEIDGSTSPDIFTALSLGVLHCHPLQGGTDCFSSVSRWLLLSRPATEHPHLCSAASLAPHHSHNQHTITFTLTHTHS